MVTIDSIRLRKKVVESLENSSTRKAALNVAERKFDEAKMEMLEEFDDHLITQEIKAGPHSDNISNTLDGKGNLFSFIGFFKGDEPTEVVREYLEESTKLKRSPEFNKRTSIFTFWVAVPTMEGVEKKTPLLWEPKSWVKAIETGISGLGHYIYFHLAKEKPPIKGSLSGSGLQEEEPNSGLVYKKAKYFSEIVRNFRNKLKSKIE